MPRSRLSAEESALWARVAATVTPLAGRATAPHPERRPGEGWDLLPQQGAAIARDASLPRDDGKKGKPKPSPPPADTLDGGWDRRLRRGVVTPDRTIDLHGHTLATAHDALDHAIARAVADDVRVLLVVTGKPRPDDRKRGLIRANIGDWIGHSGYSSRIAAVRNAHPRHGGTGALYLIFRRKRDG
jgi:DNA-nicking Smr family endonuclease